MKEYKIPVVWSSWGHVIIEAESPEDAYKKAVEYEENHGFELPMDGYYLEESFVIENDIDMIEYLSK